MSNQDDLKREIVDIAGELDQRGLRDEADAVTELLANVVRGEGMSREAAFNYHDIEGGAAANMFNPFSLGALGGAVRGALKPGETPAANGPLSEEKMMEALRAGVPLEFANEIYDPKTGRMDLERAQALRGMDTSMDGDRMPMGGYGMPMRMPQYSGGGMGMPMGGTAAGGPSPFDLNSIATMPPEQIQSQIERLNRQIQMLQAALPKAEAKAVIPAAPAAAAPVVAPAPAAAAPAFVPGDYLKTLQQQYGQDSAGLKGADPATVARLRADMATQHGAADALRKQYTNLAAAVSEDPDQMMKLANALDEKGKFEEADMVTAAARQAAMRRESQAPKTQTVPGVPGAPAGGIGSRYLPQSMEHLPESFMGDAKQKAQAQVANIDREIYNLKQRIMAKMMEKQQTMQGAAPTGNADPRYQQQINQMQEGMRGTYNAAIDSGSQVIPQQRLQNYNNA